MDNKYQELMLRVLEARAAYLRSHGGFAENAQQIIKIETLKGKVARGFYTPSTLKQMLLKMKK